MRVSAPSALSFKMPWHIRKEPPQMTMISKPKPEKKISPVHNGRIRISTRGRMQLNTKVPGLRSPLIRAKRKIVKFSAPLLQSY